MWVCIAIKLIRYVHIYIQWSAKGGDIGCSYNVLRQAVPQFHNISKKAVFIGIYSR